MKKLILSVIIILSLTVFVGCSDMIADLPQPTKTELVTKATENFTVVPTKATEVPTEEPTPAPTEKPTQAAKEESSDDSGEMYISDEAYYTMADANYIQLNDDNSVVMQINLLEAVVQVTGTYSGSKDGIITFSEMVDPSGNLVVKEGAELHKYVDGLRILYGVQDRFVLQGWNAPPAYRDGSFFRSPDSSDFEYVHG